MNLKQQLVAHRGYSSEYPENTSLAIQSALALGAFYVELDVQLTADLVPVVVHDADLIRTTGSRINVMELKYGQLIDLSAHEPHRFGNKFLPQRIRRLREIVNLFQEYNERTLIVEAKRSSIRKFGVENVLNRVRSELAPIINQSILISFDEEFIRHAKQADFTKVGWVFDCWRSNILDRISSLNPHYVFADYECIPRSIKQLPEDWCWGVYTIDDPNIALQWFNKGALLVETNNIRALLNHASFL